MLFQLNFFEPIIAIVVMFVLISLMLIITKKFDIWVIVLIIFSFSLIIGIQALQWNIPFTPYIQIFFILIQTTFFIYDSIKTFKKEV